MTIFESGRTPITVRLPGPGSIALETALIEGLSSSAHFDALLELIADDERSGEAALALTRIGAGPERNTTELTQLANALHEVGDTEAALKLLSDARARRPLEA
ncbi:MAG: hypothetical protein ACI841_002771, partial [Planctomycetota bacterium]